MLRRYCVRHHFDTFTRFNSSFNYNNVSIKASINSNTNSSHTGNSASNHRENTNRLIVNAFNKGQIEHGFKLLQNLASTQYGVQNTSLLAYWNYCQTNTNMLTENVSRMLNHIEAIGVPLSGTSLSQMIALLEENGITCANVPIDER